MRVDGWAATAAGGPLAPFAYELDDPAPGEVRVAVSHCSICFSDIDVIDNVFGITQFPAVAGHEILGTVVAAGAGVSHLQAGDLVGIGPQRGACLRCERCVDARENLCSATVSTAASGFPGGFATAIQMLSDFVFAIPDGLNTPATAPLLCAGLTVFSPLRRHSPSPSRVGVVGIGGLGHLALQFAAAMGHHVTSFTNATGDDDRKRQYELGADDIVDTTDPAEMKAARNSVDFLLSTVHGSVDFAPYVAALRPSGTLCLVGNTPGPIGDVLKHLVLGQRTITGSAQGSRADMRAMLEFAAREGIAAVVEVAPMNEINAAIERVRRAEPRYRVVLAAPGNE